MEKVKFFLKIVIRSQKSRRNFRAGKRGPGKVPLYAYRATLRVTGVHCQNDFTTTYLIVQHRP